MRVAIVIGSLRVGGAENQAARLACELATRGHSTKVFLLRDTGPGAALLDEAEVPYEVMGFHGYEVEHPLRTARALLRGFRALRTFQPDVVHGFLVGGYQYAMPLAWLLRVPVRVRGCRTSGEASAVRKRSLPILRLARRASNLVIPNASALAEELIEDGTDPASVVVIPNGVDVPPLTADVARQSAEGYVVANLHPQKNHFNLLDALAAMEEPPVVHLIGSGPEEGAIRARVDELGLGGVVVLHGGVPGAADLFSNGQFGILSSDFEGMPNAVLECMARGVPMIATAVSGVPDVITDGVDGLLVPPRDPVALARAIEQVARDPDLRLRLGHAARVRAKEFSWERCADRHVESYQAVLRGDRPGRQAQSMPRLRIVLVVPRLPVGGAETQMAQFAHALTEAGHSVRVVALAEGGPVEELLAQWGIETHILGYRGINLRAPHRTIADLKPLWRLMRNADVVQSYLSYANVPAMWVAAMARVPVRVSTRRVRLEIEPSLRGARRWLQIGASRLSGAVVANSVDGATDAVAVGYIAPHKVKVIENGVVIPEQPADVRKEPPEGVIVARLEPVKAHADLLQALSLMTHPPAIHVVGDGSERASLERLASQLGLEETVHFEGRVGGSDFVARAQFACLVSHSEGMPNAVLEAMAAGVPVIATAVGGIPELVENGVSGVLVEPGDTKALAMALEALVSDPGLRERLGEAGRLTARRYGWPSQVARHEALYEAVLRRTRRGRARLRSLASALRAPS